MRMFESNTERCKEGRKQRMGPKWWPFGTFMTWVIIIGGVILLVNVTSCSAAEHPESVKRRGCGDLNTWQLNNSCNHIYIIVDCEGNIWFLQTHNGDIDAAVIREKILYTAEDLRKGTKIVEETIKQHKLSAKKHWNSK